MLSTTNFYKIKISAWDNIKITIKILFYKMTMDPVYLHSYNCSVVSFLISSWIFLKSLFPLNFGPKTGKFGNAYNLIYLLISVSFLIEATLI